MPPSSSPSSSPETPPSAGASFPFRRRRGRNNTRKNGVPRRHAVTAGRERRHVSPERREEELQSRVGYTFRDPRHLREALTHSSFAHENPEDGGGHNERLEFLGDAVLGLAAAAHLSAASPEAREGELSRMRSSLVDRKSLAAAARALRLGEFLRLGRGEEHTGGREKESVLAGAAEALVGSVFRDGGWLPAYRLAQLYFRETAAAVGCPRPVVDAKTRLQELCQEKRGNTPSYRLLEQAGPDHDPLFTVAVFLGDDELAVGRGASKKEAEQEAAAAAIGVVESVTGEGP